MQLVEGIYIVVPMGKGVAHLACDAIAQQGDHLVARTVEEEKVLAAVAVQVDVRYLWEVEAPGPAHG